MRPPLAAQQLPPMGKRKRAALPRSAGNEPDSDDGSVTASEDGGGYGTRSEDGSETETESED